MVRLVFLFCFSTWTTNYLLRLLYLFIFRIFEIFPHVFHLFVFCFCSFWSLISLFGSIFSCLFVFLDFLPSAIFWRKKKFLFLSLFLNFFLFGVFCVFMFLSCLSYFFSLFFCFCVFHWLQLFFKKMEISLPCFLVENYVFANFLCGKLFQKWFLLECFWTFVFCISSLFFVVCSKKIST